MLMVRNLYTEHDCTALRGVSLAVEDQSITAIIGPGGAGKTTLANCICGFLPVAAGEIIFEGRDITRRPAHERLMRGIACVPAALRLFHDISVLENLELGSADCSQSVARRQYEFVLSLFPELKPCLPASAAGLPPCMQRILMFARALMSAPRLLILDRPFYGLSGEQTQRLTRAISNLNYSTSLLVLEQNVFQAVRLADTVYCMSKGRMTGKHSGLDLLADHTLQSEFLRGVLQPATEAFVP